MSQRVKKPGRPAADDSQGKRRRRRPSGSDADEDGTRSGSNSGGNGSLTGMWTPRHLNDLKVSSIYNRNSAEAPAELYRKDLISAMKLPDSEPLTPEEYWLITDSWKQEWEKGVQVPVNPESLPEPEVKLIQPVAERSHDFRLPKKKYVRVTHDDFFNPDYHQLVSTAARAEKVCSYDLDDVDAAWLGCSNADRAMQNTTLISEFLMEQVIEELELQCWEQVQTILKSQEGLGIEYDENVICDVCRSPESEEGNEMVFCDSCNICVHQACYGITTIPSGSWLCRTCTLGIKPTCVLCPNIGGAMKATRSGHTWAHVACAIWIPEVSIGSVEKMEPITKISSIPQSRWSLVCVLCKEKTGACIQCSVKTCKTAYHVTCAFKNGLEMKPIIVDENAEDGIKLRSYCQKHSVNTKKDKSQSGSEAEDAEKKKMKAMTAEERNQARAEKLQQIEAEFYKYVRLKDVSQNLAVDMDVVILIYNYWKLKRKSLNNRPLVPPRPETTQLLTQQQEQDLEQMKMFVQLRQDLERVRNLCYMVSRREKLSRSFFRLREQTFQKQLALLSEPNDLTAEERTAVLAANHGPSIYDQFYSHNSNSSSSKGALPDYESLISMIAGGLEAKKETLLNGIIKAASSGAGTGNKKHAKTAAAGGAPQVSAGTSKEPSAGASSATSAAAMSSKEGSGNPYRKPFLNGASARRNKLLGDSSHSESESESKPDTAKATTKVATPSPPVKGKKGKAAATTTPPDAKTKEPAKKTKGASARKPLSYLFDSDSSVENATPAQPSGKKAPKASLTTKGGKGKGKAATATAAASAASAPVPPKNLILKGSVKSTSYLSDSDELELPAGRGVASASQDSSKPIYSDSEDDVKSATGLTTKKDAAKTPAAAKKEKAAAKKTKASQEGTVLPETPSPKKGKKSATLTPTASAGPKGKGKAGGKKGKKDVFDPTELIVPQREAAKKATESIRSVKQKTKDQQQAAKDEEGGITMKEETTQKETPEKPKKSNKVSTLSDSEGEDKTTTTTATTKTAAPGAGRKGKSPERKLATNTSATAGGKGKRGAAATSSALLNAIAVDESVDDDEDEFGTTGDNIKDEFDFDVGRDGSSKNVSYVPQRQAAKKAAEHIRSGLSNIVAARLIIEDEMEATRKKQKTDKSGGSKTGGDDQEAESRLAGHALASDSKDKIENAVAEAAKKVTSKDRSGAPANKGLGKGAKGSRKDGSLLGEGVTAAAAAVTGGKDAARGGRDSADWPFLDKGSQSACRRSRERSSSSGSSSGSSGSSSSGSSCSSSRSSSASSSRSSSAESASPEPRSPVIPTTATSTKGKASNQSQVISTVVGKLSTAASQDTGPGRKLKTSERVPPTTTSAKNRGAPVRAETSTREKPAPKGNRSTKSGPRGGGDPFRSAFSPSPEPEPKPTATSTGADPTSSNNNKVSPISKTTHEKQQQQRSGPGGRNQRASPVAAKSGRAQSPEKKGGRRKGESSSPAGKVGRDKQRETTEKDSDSEAASRARARAASPAKAAEKRSPAKALAGNRGRQSSSSPVKQQQQQQQQHTGPHLSSESETEVPPPPPPTTRNRKNSSQPDSASPCQQRRRRGEPSNVGATSLGLSDSDEESGTEEKENAQRRDGSDLHHHSFHASSPVVSSKSKGGSQRGGSTPALPSATYILSPLTPTENKEKEMNRLSDTEQPETKRPRLDSASSSTATGAASTSGGQPLKSIFSPTGSTGTGRENDIGLDFDTELYDLAKSVVTEEYTHGGDCEDESVGESLHFNFTHGLFLGEDNKEDSARATLNLVEKLRLQHAKKSTGHRQSTDSMSDSGQCDNLLDEKSTPNSSRPGSSLTALQDDAKESSTPAREQFTSEEESRPRGGDFVSGVKSPSDNLLHGRVAHSPDRTKQTIQGDERWVPPSSGASIATRQHSPASSSAPTSIPSNLVAPPQPSPRSQFASNTTAMSDQSQQQDRHSEQEGSTVSSDSSKQHLRSPSSYHARADKSNLSVETLSSPPTPVVASPMVSPLLAGRQQPSNTSLGPPPPPYNPQNAAIAAHAAAAMAAAEASPNNIAAAAAAAAGLPFGANPFLYPALANNPAFASVVSSLAAAAAAGANPLAPFLQVPPGTKQGPGSPGFPPFIPPSVMQQGHPPSTTSAAATPTPSPGASSTSSSTSAQQQAPSRRTSDVSPLVTVATSMPPLAKPPLTSPSILLAASNCKSVSAPPLHSAVAHIIESVVNNHQASTASSSNLPKTTLSLDMMHLPPHSSAVAPTSSTNPSAVKTPLTSPVVANTAIAPPTDIAAVLGNKTTENILTPTNKSIDHAGSGASVEAPTQHQLPPPPPPPVTAGAGRGRRASTPRAAKQAAEKLSGVNAVIEDMMMSPIPKGKGGRKGASPGRGKGPSTPAKRGSSSGGRGKGKGKNLVGVRKDLAGTVYDIDFDEFEENAQEKIDLRSLRERRKSSEVHHTGASDGGKHSKHQSTSDHSSTTNSSPIVLTLPVPHSYRQTKEEKRANKVKEKELREKEKELEKQQKKLEKMLLKQQQQQQKVQQQQQQKQQPLVAPLKISLNDTIRQHQAQHKEQERRNESEQASEKPSAPVDKVQSPSVTVPTTAALLQAPLPGPVDMRTYSASTASVTAATVTATTTSTGTLSSVDDSSILGGKLGFPAIAKDPSSEIASLFGMSSSVVAGEISGSVGGASSTTVVNELEELNKALDDLVAKPKQQTTSDRAMSSDTEKVGVSLSTSNSSAVNDVISPVSVVASSNQLEQNLNTQQQEAVCVSTSTALPTTTITSQPTINSTPGSNNASFSSHLQAEVVSNGAAGDNASQQQQVGNLLPSGTSSMSSIGATDSDLSRNQLKVKIKGPFLDANYSSAATNSLAPSGVGFHPSHAHPHGYHPHHLQPNPMASNPNSITGAGAYPPPPHFPAHHHHQQWMMNSSSSSASNSMDNNPSNLRRMRKKELLRKYWNEDMNMDGGPPSVNPSGYPLGAPGSMVPGHHHYHHDGGSSLMGQHGPSHHPHHPLGRSVITIPKAVASMSILPSTQDDHDPAGFDPNSDMNDPLGFGGLGDPSSWKDGLGGAKDGGKPQQKKRRSRGIYREMAALGILPPDAVPRNERRRDRQQGAAGSASGQGTQSPSGSATGSDSNSRKRVRGSNKPSRSTFIPPTLADNADSPAGATDGMLSSSNSATASASGKGASASTGSGVSAVVNVVNHPTPKLKIKFGEMSNSAQAGSSGMTTSTSGNTSSSLQNNTNHLSDSDKEAPNKKAKGRPPKKRGLPDTAAASSSRSTASTSANEDQMERLKRESMKYREMVVKDFQRREQQEILKLSGTRRSKKHKRKAGASAAGSETDDANSVRSKSPAEVKIIDGPTPKLILRIGRKKGKKGKADGSGNVSDNSCSSGRNSAADKISQNGLPIGQQNENSQGGLEGENDSGFTTASAEGSSGSGISVNDAITAASVVKDKTVTMTSSNNNNNNNNDKSGSGSTATAGISSIRNGGGAAASVPTDKVLVVELSKVDGMASVPENNKLSEKCAKKDGGVATSVSGAASGENSPANSTDKPYVPIRLKLSRCYEGSYSLKNKKEGANNPGGLDGENGGASGAGAPPPAKQTSDSCQVR